MLPGPVESAVAIHGTRSNPHPKNVIDILFGSATLYAAVLALLVYLSVPHTFADPDIWWHLRDAEVLAQTHRFITHDMFSFTAAGAPWMNHEWLAELPFYAAWKLAGTRGLYVVTLLLIEAVMLGVFALALKRSRNLVLSLVLTAVGTLFATVSFGPRTLLMGWLLLLLELALLHVATSRRAAVWALPVLFVIWVNTHGSWMIGLVVYALFVSGSALPLSLPFLHSDGLHWKDLRRMLLAGAASVAVLFVNPYGWRLVAYPFNLAFHQKLNIATVEEWRPLDFHSPRGKLALLCVLALAVWQLVRPHRWKLADLLFVLVGLYSGFTYSRFLFLFTILCVPAIAATLSDRYAARPRPNRPLLNVACICVIACTIWVHARHARGSDPRSGKPIPENFPAALASVPPQARVFNDYMWGGRLIWQDHLPVFIDSRVDIFEYNGTFKDYLDIIHLHNTLGLLDQHRITHVIFEANTPLVYLLQHTPGWTTVYEQENVVLLQRSQAQPSQSHAST